MDSCGWLVGVLLIVALAVFAAWRAAEHMDPTADLASRDLESENEAEKGGGPWCL